MERSLLAVITGIIVASCALTGFIADQKPRQLLVSESFFKQLIKEHEEIHAKNLFAIKHEFAIPDKDWKKTLEYIDQLKRADTLKGVSNFDFAQESPFVNRVYAILADYHINPERVVVKNLHGSAYKAQAFQEVAGQEHITHTLELNSEWLDNYPAEIQEGILRHEIMHLLNYDCLEEDYLMGLLESLGHDPKEYSSKESIIAYRRHRELRADLLASCSSPAIADALRYYYEACAIESNHYKPQTWNTHPKDAQRAQELAHLLTNMNNSSEIIA